jgi:hypothetical protein
MRIVDLTNADQLNAERGTRNSERGSWDLTNADCGLRNRQTAKQKLGKQKAEISHKDTKTRRKSRNEDNAECGIGERAQPNAELGTRNAEVGTEVKTGTARREPLTNAEL